MCRVRSLKLSICLLVLFSAFSSALAQSGSAPRRVTFDGRSTPLRWDATGLFFSRPGAKLNWRIANELWRIDPASGSAQQVSPDAPLGGRAPSSSSAFARVFVVNDGTLQPELWLANPDGRSARLLLKGDGEYFGSPIISPDGRRFAFTRTPSGSETHGFSAIWVGEVNDGAVRQRIIEASSPVWSPDGGQLAFEHRGDVYVSDWRLEIRNWQSEVETNVPTFNAPNALTPPATIRVYHAQGNADFSQVSTCRAKDLPVGAIQTFAFEDYVRFVVPIEASPSNPPEHLKAQAVAARTYAWQRINPANPYDVSDWTDSQAMCDLRADPRTDAATSATAGQYIAYQGALIAALYCAETGDPTRKCPFGGGCAYLQSVDDPVSFGRARLGHGGGLSQGGSQRWASWYGWNYIQILTHYYSNVTIEGQTDFGSLTAPWQNGYVNANRARIVGNASNGRTLDVFAQGEGLTTTLVATNTLLSTLDLSTLPDQPLRSLLISANLSSTQVSTLTLGLDRLPPTGTLTLPAFASSPTITAQLSATDMGPSGFAGWGLSNNWRWEGEDKLAQGYVLGAGGVVSDAQALNGRALFAPLGSSIIWYGPYTFDLPIGQGYRAYFRLKTNTITTTSQLAKLDVVADGANPIGIKRIYGTDFRALNQYQEFFVDFNYVVSPTLGVEFRVDSEGALPGDLYLDRVLVATYPLTTPLTTSWTLPVAFGPPQTVIAKFSDNAGNVSADVVGTVAFSDTLKLFLPLIRKP